MGSPKGTLIKIPSWHRLTTIAAVNQGGSGSDREHTVVLKPWQQRPALKLDENLIDFCLG